MTRRVRVTSRAESDVRSIGAWIARQSDSAETAIAWLDRLDALFRALAETPGIGTARPDLRPGLRSIPFGNYLIFFKTSRSELTIVRVIHGARDYRRLFR
jgi:toxin ParE1/3/4